MQVSTKISTANFTKFIAQIFKKPRFTGLSNLTESGDGTVGYTYSGTVSGRANTSSLNLPVLTDGYFQMKPTTLAGGPLLQVSSNNTGTAYNSAGVLYGVWLNGGSYYAVTAGVSAVAQVARTPVLGDIIRLRRVAGVWTIQVSSDAGTTYAVIHTFATNSTVLSYPLLLTMANGAVGVLVEASPSVSV